VNIVFSPKEWLKEEERKETWGETRSHIVCLIRGGKNGLNAEGLRVTARKKGKYKGGREKKLLFPILSLRVAFRTEGGGNIRILLF